MDEVIECHLKNSDPELDALLDSVNEMNECLEDELSDLDSDDICQPASEEAFQKEDPDSIPLYPGASVTIGAFMLLLAVFTTKYNLVGDAIHQLLNIIAFALPNGHNLCTTLHEFKKYFRNLRNPLLYHYYCSYCQGLVNDKTQKTCSYKFCGKPFDIKSAHYFLEIPLKNQIQNLFAQEDFCDHLQHRFNRSATPGTYSDIYDGKLYKSFLEKDGFLRDEHNISFTFNTDGAPVFKSSKVSVWPIFLVINELPYKQRMKKENMILASLWFGCQKPSMGIFLKPFKKTMEELYAGIECNSPGQGSFISRGILLCGTADLPARSLLCNHMQYNGAFSCWKCEQEGMSDSVGKGHARVFPFNKNSPKGPERTACNVLQNARVAIEKLNAGNLNQISCKGIKGPSWLTFFPRFNIISGIAIDYMHGVLLGVQKLLLELWFLQKFVKKTYNFYGKLSTVDERLMHIRPTLDITRLPRSIHDMKYWKASEYRSFMLFFGAPVLNGILDNERFNHYLLFVNSMHILLKCGSTDKEINRAEQMITNFCEHFDRLYDRCFMRLNVHQLLHLPDCVRNLGPLYTHSCFSFEDKNGVLLKMIRGTQNIDHQIVTGVSFVQKLPELKMKCITKGSNCEKLYNSIEAPCLLKRTTKIENGIYVLGGIKERILSEEEISSLTTYLKCDPIARKFSSFSRIEVHENVIYGLTYSRMVKRDNSVIEYKSADSQNKLFGQVHFFIFLAINDAKQTLAFIEKLNCVNYGDEKSILAVTKTNKLEVQPVQNIISNCMLVSCLDAKTNYICRFPNRMESD